MKKYFSTGLAILAPIALTLIVVMIFVNILTKPFVGIVNTLLTPFFGSPEVILIISKILILIFLFCLVLLTGVIAHRLAIEYFVHIGDNIFHRIPLFNKVYKATKEVVNTVLSPGSATFKQVVLVPFPTPTGLSIGFVTSDKASMDVPKLPHEYISVFVPCAPNPIFGYLLLFRKDQVLYVEMTVEQALKSVVSCGSILTPFSVRKPL